MTGIFNYVRSARLKLVRVDDAFIFAKARLSSPVKALINLIILRDSRIAEAGVALLLQRGESHIDSIDWHEITDYFGGARMIARHG